MKKNYVVSEEEKNRILGLHESFKKNTIDLVVEQEETTSGTGSTETTTDLSTTDTETVDDIMKDVKIVGDSEEQNSESGDGDGSGEIKVKKNLSKIQDASEVRKLVDKIQKIQAPLVTSKSKVNLFKNRIAAKRMSRKGFVGQVKINGYGSIIMNDGGTKMVGITFPVLMKNPKDGKYSIQNKLTYKFLLNKLRLGDEKVVANKKFRGYLKQVEVIHKDLNKELSKIPQGDF